MIVDLNPLPYRHAMELIRWCAERRIDQEKCLTLIEAMATAPTPEVDWTLDVPDQYITSFLLKWSGRS